MTSITEGKRLHGKDFRSGVSARGAWEMVHVSDEKGHGEITVWFNNVPTGMTAPGGDFVVKKIIEVKNGMRKSKTTDKWFPSVDVEVEVEVVEPDTSFDDAMAAGVFEEMPAAAATDPWAGTTVQEKMPWDDVDVGDEELPF